MKLSVWSLCLSVLLLVVISIPAMSLPLYTLESPFRSDQPSKTLIVRCGALSEFDASLAGPVLPDVPASTSPAEVLPTDEQPPGPITAVPEPSTLIMLGVGVLGVLGVVRRTRKAS